MYAYQVTFTNTMHGSFEQTACRPVDNYIGQYIGQGYKNLWCCDYMGQYIGQGYKNLWCYDYIVACGNNDHEVFCVNRRLSSETSRITRMTISTTLFLLTEYRAPYIGLYTSLVKYKKKLEKNN